MLLMRNSNVIRDQSVCYSSLWTVAVMKRGINKINTGRCAVNKSLAPVETVLYSLNLCLHKMIESCSEKFPKQSEARLWSTLVPPIIEDISGWQHR